MFCFQAHPCLKSFPFFPPILITVLLDTHSTHNKLISDLFAVVQVSCVSLGCWRRNVSHPKSLCTCCSKTASGRRWLFVASLVCCFGFFSSGTRLCKVICPSAGVDQGPRRGRTDGHMGYQENVGTKAWEQCSPFAVTPQRDIREISELLDFLLLTWLIQITLGWRSEKFLLAVYEQDWREVWLQGKVAKNREVRRIPYCEWHYTWVLIWWCSEKQDDVLDHVGGQKTASNESVSAQLVWENAAEPFFGVCLGSLEQLNLLEVKPLVVSCFHNLAFLLYVKDVS